MGYSNYLDKDSKNILLEYQNIFFEKNEYFLDRYYKLLEEQITSEFNPKDSGEQGEYYGIPKGSYAEDALKYTEYITTPPDKWWSMPNLEWLRWLGTGIAVFEPFGVLSYPQFLRAWQEWNNINNAPEGEIDNLTWWWFALKFVIAGFNALPNFWALFEGYPGLAPIVTKATTRIGMRKIGPAAIDVGVELIQALLKNPQLKEKVFAELDKYIFNITKNPKPYRDGLQEIKKIIEDPNIVQNAEKLKEFIKNVGHVPYKKFKQGYDTALNPPGPIKRTAQAGIEAVTFPKVQGAAQVTTRGTTRLGGSAVPGPQPKEDSAQSWINLNR